MQNQEQQSSRCSSPRNPSSSSGSSSSNLLQTYANRDIDILPPEVINELQNGNFSGVDLSGAMKLTDISVLAEDFRKETLEQSIKIELEPFASAEANKFIEAVKQIKCEMSLDDFMDNVKVIAETDVDEVLPKYFKRQSDPLVAQCKRATALFDSLADSNSLLEGLIVSAGFVNKVSEISKDLLTFKSRWETIRNIQDVRVNGETILKIPAGYPYGLPAYLHLLSGLENHFRIEIVDSDGAPVSDAEKDKFKKELVNFGLESRLDVGVAPFTNEWVELPGPTEGLLTPRQSSVQHAQTPQQEGSAAATTPTEPEEPHIVVELVDLQPAIPQEHSPRRDQFTSTGAAREPSTEGATTESSPDSRVVHPGTDYSDTGISEGERISPDYEQDRENMDPSFYNIGQQLAAFAGSNSDSGVDSPVNLISMDVGGLTINPTTYSPRK